MIERMNKKAVDNVLKPIKQKSIDYLSAINFLKNDTNFKNWNYMNYII